MNIIKLLKKLFKTKKNKNISANDMMKHKVEQLKKTK